MSEVTLCVQGGRVGLHREVSKCASSPIIQHRQPRCFSAGHSRVSPSRNFPIGAYHWAVGGRCPSGPNFAGGHRAWLRQNRIPISLARARPLQSRAISTASCSQKDPLRNTMRPDLGLAISGSRPGSASTKGNIEDIESRDLLPRNDHMSNTFDHETNEYVLAISLVAVGNGKALRTVVSEGTRIMSLQARLAKAHASKQNLHSTIEIWDGEVVHAAEGLIKVHEVGPTDYSISHDFLELSNLDLGSNMFVEDGPDMRLTIESSWQKIVGKDALCSTVPWQRATLTIAMDASVCH